VLAEKAGFCMSHILSDLYIAAGVVFLFGAAIFVHEFGHFWVALKRGLKVEEFAIGFGPKIRFLDARRRRLLACAGFLPAVSSSCRK
jgi:membrane-associated protease RseP (regulator of RpoE activity)